jgi:pimeloyl-ACP methyl ester carboxylesterase
MLKKITLFVTSIPFLSSFLFSAPEWQTVKANAIDICFQTFGQKNHPPLLLIMGAGGQGIVWPTAFCKQLAKRGFYVIRYDQRDAGLSTCVDFEKNPYELLDMAKDAIGLLDALHIKKAHLFGLSMGGSIAELMAVHFPDRVLTIALMGSHFDYRPFYLSLAGLPAEPEALSGPRQDYLEAVVKIAKMPSVIAEEKVEQQMAVWRLINGSVFPLDEVSTKAMLREFISRSPHPDNLKNYRHVISAAKDLLKTLHPQVKVSALIFQGLEDPILGPDHAKALEKAISNSRLLLVKGMGHLPNQHFFETLINELAEHTAIQKP